MTIKTLLLGISLVGLAGCAQFSMMSDQGDDGLAPDKAEAARNAAASVPDLRPGDRFTFDNPQVTWEVVAVAGNDEVAWRADDGETQITSSNPLLPALEWSSSTRGNGKRLISAMSEPMFPLESGKKITFRSTVDTDTPPYAWEFDWQCHTGKLETVSVPAGQFAAYRIDCGRQQSDELIFYYAPEVGNYVRMIIADSEGGPPAERRLLAYERAGGNQMQMAATVPPPGAVELDAEGSAEMEASIPAEPMPTGPTALGMAAAVPQEAPSTAPQSALSSEQPPDSAPTQSAMASSDTVGAGSIAVHLTSYKKAENAELGWKQLMAANRDLLQGTRPVVRQVDIPGKGLFYRLHAGPVASESAAKELCRTLKQRGVYCKVAKL